MEVLKKFLGAMWVRYRALKLWIQIVIGIVVLSIITAPFSSSDDPKPTASETTTSTVTTEAGPTEPTTTTEARVVSFKSKVLNYAPDSPAALHVYVRTVNTGNVDVAADCTVQASDATSHYFGVDTFIIKPDIGAGDIRFWNGSLIVTNEGAQYVTRVKVECEER